MLVTSITLDMSHLEISLSNSATANMLRILVTRDTSHFEMSPLKLEKANSCLVSVTLDKSHSPIGPCLLCEQSPLVDKVHSPMAVSSSDLESGENADAAGNGPFPWMIFIAGEYTGTGNYEDISASIVSRGYVVR